MSGKSAVEAQLNEAIKSFERDFNTSPSYYSVDIDGVMVDTIINKKTKYDEKLVNFRHGYNPLVGSVVTYKDNKYLLMETDEDDIYRFGVMKKCNYIIPVKVGETKVFAGYDHNGQPYYTTEIEYEDVPCIIDSKYYSSNDNAQLPLPEGKLSVYTKYVPDSNIQTNEEYVLYEKRYIVADIDYTKVINGVGVIEIIVERKVDKE
ncbi:hypothetical protein [Virgibacillus profundi]|nr:hypothetical protein [Virgibacillus profundi]